MNTHPAVEPFVVRRERGEERPRWIPGEPQSSLTCDALIATWTLPLPPVGVPAYPGTVAAALAPGDPVVQGIALLRRRELDWNEATWAQVNSRPWRVVAVGEVNALGAAATWAQEALMMASTIPLIPVHVLSYPDRQDADAELHQVEVRVVAIPHVRWTEQAIRCRSESRTLRRHRLGHSGNRGTEIGVCARMEAGLVFCAHGRRLYLTGTLRCRAGRGRAECRVPSRRGVYRDMTPES